MGTAGPSYRSIGWSILWNLATAQLRRSASVVLDGVARAPEIARTRALAGAEGAAVLVVATSCTDPVPHRSRVEGRRRGIPGWHELTWDHVARAVAGWEPPDDADLRLDAAEPFEANLAGLVGRLATDPGRPGGDPCGDHGAK